MYLPLLERTITDPDEIWLRWEKRGQTWRLKRSYLARFSTPDGRLPGLGVFTWSNGGWSGSTLFPPKTMAPFEADGYLDAERHGLLIHRR